MKRLGIALIVVGICLLEIGVIGLAWFAGLDEGDRVNSYGPPQFQMIALAVVGLVVSFVGYALGTRSRTSEPPRTG